MGNEDRYRWAADYVDANREGPDTPSYPPIPPLSELRLSLADLRAASLTPACIVDRYLWADVGAIPGPGGTGKTSLFLFEAIHIVLGRPLYGLEVRTPGNVVIVTAEDRKGILMARLRQIMEAMGLNEEEQSRVCAGVLIWDVTGSVCRLTELDRHGNVVLTGLADAIVERFRDEPPALMGLDPVISFGAGERIVNDNEHSLILAARRIVRGLGCCVRLICHTGQVAARSMVLDQYASRGGSALADGCRMVTVLQAWQDDNEKLTPPAGFTLGAGEQGIVMARAKISYAPPQPLIWLKRRGWTFEHFIDMPATKEDEASARADQVWRYLADQLKSGARHTKTDLDGAGILPQKKLRAALSSLLVTGRVVYKPLPEEQRHGGRKEYLHPVATTPSNDGGTGDWEAQKVPPTPSVEDLPSTPSSPYREKIDDGVGVANFSQQAYHSVNEGQRGSNGVDGVEDLTDPLADGSTPFYEAFRRKAEAEPGYSKDAEARYCCVCAHRAPDKRCLAWELLGAPEGWKPIDKAPRRCRGFAPKTHQQANGEGAMAEIRGWLQRLGEDPETISEVLEACAREPGVMAGYLRSAREVPA